MRRLPLCALALLLSGCVYFSRHTLPGACAHDLGSPIRNFCVVTPGVLWRAEAPSRTDARWLVAHGVASVVSLQLDVRQSFESARLAPGLVRSVRYYRVKDFSAIKVLTHYHLDREVALTLAIIEEAPKPVLVSCRAGVDRTGIVVAAYRVLVQGMRPKAAIAELNGFHSPWDPLNDRYVRSLAGPRGAGILRGAHRWQSSGVKPDGRFECRDGGCRFVRGRLPAQADVNTNSSQRGMTHETLLQGRGVLALTPHRRARGRHPAEPAGGGPRNQDHQR